MKKLCFARHGHVFIILTIVARGFKILEGTTFKDNMGNTDVIETCDKINGDFCNDEISCGFIGACGKSLRRNEFPKICSCDYLCYLYQDCCFDFEKKCPQEFDKFNQSPLTKLEVVSICDGSYKMLMSPDLCAKDNREQTGVINSSLNGPYQPEWNTDDKYSNTGHTNIFTTNTNDGNNYDNDVKDYFYPSELVVTDLQTGLTYFNEYNYHCMNTHVTYHNLVRWEKKYISDSSFTLKDLEHFFRRNISSHHLFRYLVDIPPSSVTPRLCQPEISIACTPNCTRYYTNFYNFCNYYGLVGSINQALLSENYSEDNNGKPKSASLACSVNHVFKVDPEGGFVNINECKGRFILNRDSKTLHVDPYSSSCEGGWSQYSCVSESRHQPCQLKLSCKWKGFYLEKFYRRDQCVTPVTMTIIIQSTVEYLGYSNTRDVVFNLSDILNTQTTLSFDKLQLFGASRDWSEVQKYIYMTNLDISVGEQEHDAYENKYRTIIERILKTMNLRDKWNGTVSTCYSFTDVILSIEAMVASVKDNRRNMFCENITFIKTREEEEIEEVAKRVKLHASQENKTMIMTMNETNKLLGDILSLYRLVSTFVSMYFILMLVQF